MPSVQQIFKLTAMGDYDRVIKENIEKILQPLLGKLLNLPIKETFEIKDKLHQTMEREPDYLKRIKDENGKEFILHLEFQTHDDRDMVYRMAEYKALLQRKYKIPVEQSVIYLGTGPVNMPTKLSPEQQITGFTLRKIHDLPVSMALNSNVPEEIILAILMDFKDVEADVVINQILEKLPKATSNKTRLQRTLKQLLILSRLRNLQVITSKIVSEMPITYDITKDSLYLEGIEFGERKHKRQIILKALQLGILSIEQIAEMTDVDVAFVLELKQETEKKD